MMTIAAKRMGYRVVILDPTADSPAGQVADDQIVATYDDHVSAAIFADASDVVTIEFENIPAATLRAIEPHTIVRPGSDMVDIAQNRLVEKTFLTDNDFPVPLFYPVTDLDSLHTSLARIGKPSILKTALGGYDGKGQWKLDSPDDTLSAWKQLDGRDAIVEEFVDFDRELSVIVARDVQGNTLCYPPSENTHVDHILDTAVMPAMITPKLAKEATNIATDIATALDLVGMVAVEMFLSHDGQLLVNELAPRPHNSGHQTFDAAVTSQFEQVIRAVCGLPLGSTNLYSPVAIANLLGDLWANGEPDWATLLNTPHLKIHLYGKDEARPGRKMGHLTTTGATPEEALSRVRQVRSALA